MAFVLSDRIKETTTTTSTGTYTLGGAVSGFETFTANLSNGDTTYYCCTDGTDFEVGLGTFASSGTTLARTTIISSSNSNNAVNWSSGSRDIFCTLPGSKVIAKNGDGDITLADNEEIQLGNDADLRIFHNASHSIIKDGGTGNLELCGSTVKIRNAGRTEDLLVANPNGSVELYHDNSLRFETTSTGAKVTGGAGDGTLIIEADTDNATETDNALLQLIQDGGAVGVEFGLDSNNKIFMKGTGASGDIEFKHGDENLAILKADGAAELYHDNSKKFETTSSGATVTGTLAATLSTAAQPNITSLGTLTTLTVDDITINGSTISDGGDFTIDAGGDITLDAAGNDIRIKANGTEFLKLRNESGNGAIMPVADGTDLIFQQRDATEVARIKDNGTFDVVTDKLAINGTAITSTAAEINKLDGVTATTTELNYVDVTTLGTVQASKAVTADANGDVLFPDNEKAKFGTGGDLQISHTGSNSLIQDSGTGNLFIQGSSSVKITDLSSNEMAVFNDGGSTELYHNAVKKVETTSDGATVTGDLTVTSTADGGPNLNIKSNDHGDAADFANEGFINFIADNDADQEVTFGRIGTFPADITDGTEDGRIKMDIMSNGTIQGAYQFAPGYLFLTNDTHRIEWQNTRGTSFNIDLLTATPTANREITLPDATGTVLTTGNSDKPTTTTSSSDADFVLVDDGGTMKKITPSNLGITSGGASKGFAVAMAIAL